ncbi:hypothetical protein K0U00_42730, partial [Paenibacillus sepulcri]|nr:hypothetical protein [Paenibacillus sepulcri]
MTIYLSSIGWLSETPAGNRLRWHFPLRELADGGGYRGLPQAVIIERAPLNLRMVPSRVSLSIYPPGWWDLLGSQSVGGLLLADEFKLPGPAQAVTFVWRGAPARIEFQNSQTGELEAVRSVSDGTVVY